jgi:hypothetical protein
MPDELPSVELLREGVGLAFGGAIPACHTASFLCSARERSLY